MQTDGENRDKAYSIRRRQTQEREPTLDSNHEESDSRVWLHAFGCKRHRILIYSPDTDTYHVGLPLLEWYSNTEVTVQLAPSAPFEPYSESRFLVLNNLRLALHEDPDLADIKRPALASVLQTVFVATGCDYVSFFARIGKATFLDTLFQSASFITGSSMADHGTLTDQDHNKSMMAFYRLVAAAYFKKHCSAFEHQSPESLFKTFAEGRLFSYTTCPLP